MCKFLLALALISLSTVSSAQIKYGGDINSNVMQDLSNGPGMPVTPSFSFGIDRFRFLTGIDIYLFTGAEKNIYGPQFSAKYFFKQLNHKHNFFGEVNYRYVKYGCGGGLAVRYNVMTDNWSKMMQIKSSVASLGGGYSFKCCHRFSVYFAAGAGLNFYNARYSVVNQSRVSVAEIRENRNISPVYYVRAGLNYDMTKKRVIRCFHSVE
jgi:hypothetical protein